MGLNISAEMAPRLLLVGFPQAAADRFRAAGADVAAFACGLSALAHWDAAAGPASDRFNAAVIDENSPGLSGQVLTLALRAGGFAGTVVGLADDPGSAAAHRWRARGCDLILPKGGAGAETLAWAAATLYRAAGEAGGEPET